MQWRTLYPRKLTWSPKNRAGPVHTTVPETIPVYKLIPVFPTNPNSIHMHRRFRILDLNLINAQPNGFSGRSMRA